MVPRVGCVEVVENKYWNLKMLCDDLKLKID
jgi:hypothetical protein